MGNGNVISGSLWRTRFLGGREAGAETVPVRRLGTLVLTFLIVIFLIGTSLFFVWSRLRVVSLGYQLSQAVKLEKELIEINKKLRIERATLISPERVDFYARQKLGMREPQKDQIRFVP